MEIQIDKSLFEQLSFLVTGKTEFIVVAEKKEEVKGTFDVFWQQNNVYLMANIQKQEEVQVRVTSLKKHQVVF